MWTPSGGCDTLSGSRVRHEASYRADVDGLRAVAVLSVLLFHLHVAGFSGGYVGVDVFFVISGYLITGLVAAELGRGTFSLRTFYARRVRRLAPALIVVTFAAVLAAWLLLSPEDMRSFASSLSVQFVFLQNVVFLKEGEYFHSRETKLLLHTWTLAVEEQFYLLWPLFLLLTRRLKLGWRVALLLVVMAASFTLNVVLLKLAPKASFFLLPARAWELGLGGLLALLERDGVVTRWLTQRALARAGAGGLLAVAASVVLFGPDTPFPGYAALLPVFGAALVIAAGIGGGSRVGRALSHPAVVHVGLISYPIYLWHWPLLSAAYHLGLDLAKPAFGLVVAVLTLGLAELTYRLVETPIRTRRWLPTTRGLLAAAGTCALALTAFGVHAYTTKGALYRFPPAARPFLAAGFAASDDRCGFVFRVLHPRGQVCALREQAAPKQRILLWGNSHADMWSRAFTELAAAHDASVYMNARNCRVTVDSPYCDAATQDALLRFIEEAHITDVVVISTWYGVLGIPDDVFERSVAEAFPKLARIHARIWLVVDTPKDPSFAPLAEYAKNPQQPAFGFVPLATYLAEKNREEALFRALQEADPKIRILDPSGPFCDQRGCWSGKDGQVWYRDKDHITLPAARALVHQFLPIFTSAR